MHPVLQDKSYQVVSKAIQACKDDEIKAIVAGLDSDSHDHLMKYIYKGLAFGDNSGSLLKWHAATHAQAGVGCIVRAITDRKTVLSTD
jgi:actin related protein 2/3 complex subunit 5